MYKILITKNYISSVIAAIMIFMTVPSIGQSPISLNNPSFEDTPSDATTPMGWFECTEYTTPDILPGFWGVYNEANDGDTYIGMITRENHTWESIGQRLSEPLLTSECYEFTMDMAHSYTYAGYNEPIGVKIYISDQKCGRTQLVEATKPITNKEWETRKFKFTPEQKSYYILIEVSYPEGMRRTKGNVLLDNISLIVKCNRA